MFQVCIPHDVALRHIVGFLHTLVELCRGTGVALIDLFVPNLGYHHGALTVVTVPVTQGTQPTRVLFLARVGFVLLDGYRRRCRCRFLLGLCVGVLTDEHQHGYDHQSDGPRKTFREDSH